MNPAELVALGELQEVHDAHVCQVQGVLVLFFDGKGAHLQVVLASDTTAILRVCVRACVRDVFSRCTRMRIFLACMRTSTKNVRLS